MALEDTILSDSGLEVIRKSAEEIPPRDPEDDVKTGYRLRVRSIGASTVDVDNSTSAPLLADGVFTGSFTNILEVSQFTVSTHSDQASATSSLVVEFSTDGVNIDDTDEFSIAANAAKHFTFGAAYKFVRVRYTNGSTAQGFFRLQTLLHPFARKASSHRVDDLIIAEDDSELVKAILTGKDIGTGFFENVSVRNGRLQVDIDIAALPDEFFLTDSGGSFDMSIDGIATPTDFTLDADVTRSYKVEELRLSATAGSIQSDKWIEIAALTNGFRLKVISGGVIRADVNLKTTNDIFQRFAKGPDHRYDLITGVGNPMLVATFTQPFIIFRQGEFSPAADDEIRVTVRDDLSTSGITRLEMSVLGRFL